MFNFTSVIVAFLVIWLFQLVQRKINRLAPGPLIFPFIGNYPQIVMAGGKKPYAAFHKMAQNYGDLMSIKLGFQESVIISGYETLKKVLNNDEFLGRFAPNWFLHRTFGAKIGILFADIPIWRESRRFTVKNLRDFGFGKKHTMESIIVQEVEEFTRRIEVGVPVNMGGRFDAPVINSVFAMLCGFRFEHTDQELQTLLDLVHEYFASIKNGTDILAGYPFLAPIVPSYYRQQRINKAVHAYFRKIIQATRDRGTYKYDPQNFVDIFVSKIDSTASTPGNSNKDDDKEVNAFTDENLISILYDFFIAGAETTSSSLQFLILHLILNPEIQEKIAAEVNEKVGKERWPSYEDKDKMPYTEAVILENLRIATTLPIGPRQADNDIEFGGYRILKGSYLGINYYSVHMDESYWKDPQNFRPERFLDEHGRLTNTERVIPFSLGKRSCIGENLGRMNLFLFTSRLFQLYKISPVPNQERPSTEPLVGITMAPQPFSAIFTKR